MRKFFLVVGAVGVLAMPALAAVGPQLVTLPAAASIVGGAPFFSDVRAFNTSYSSSLDVTATYRCFLAGAGGSCTSGTPVFPFTLQPRESRALNDIVAQTFLAPNTAGGVEFAFTGESEQLVVTSRLFSTQPTPTVGMFIPGLEASSDAFATTILTSVRNGGSGAGFRTNVGLFNPNDTAVTVSFQIFDGGNNPTGNAVTVPGGIVAGHSGAQINGIFTQAGVPALSTDNAVVLVTANAPIFSYAAVIDNNTTDPIFVVGAQDQPPQATHATRVVHVGANGQIAFVDDQSGNGATSIHVGDTVTWVWDGTMHHGVDSGRCTGGGGYGGGGGCSPDGTFGSGVHSAPFSYSHIFDQAGSFPYFCDVHMGLMTGHITVDPAPAGAVASSASKRRPLRPGAAP